MTKLVLQLTTRLTTLDRLPLGEVLTSLTKVHSHNFTARLPGSNTQDILQFTHFSQDILQFAHFTPKNIKV